MTKRWFCFCCLALPLIARASAGSAPYQVQLIEGWTVHVSGTLRGAEPAATAKALDLLTAHLKEIVRVVPGPAVAHLQKVPLWLSPLYPDQRSPRAEYHPDAGWLRENGRDPAMAKAVEITNVLIFEKETKRMPVFILHELAHAYHDRVLGFNNARIEAAYRRAVASRSYDAVKLCNGKIARAYAMTNAKEYFAETTEAFFGRNDFFPFNRDELAQHDPEMFHLLADLWGCRPEPVSAMKGSGP